MSFYPVIYVLMKKNTKQNSSSFINFFNQTYKNKIIISLCYLNSFPKLFFNNNLKCFREMDFQLVNENLSKLVYQDQNIQFLETCFEEIYSVCNYFLQIKDYDTLREMTFWLKDIMTHLPSKSIIDKMNSNIKLINIMINICCLINNTNVFETITQFNKSQISDLINDLFYTESNCFSIIICLIHIINFDNNETINYIFNIIFEKIYEFKKYKESLQNVIFTPHLIIIKCYSAFLNRFCFNYSVKNECDLLDSFIHFINIYPQSKEINEFIFTELINVFGFIISQLHSFFNYFGEDMFDYYLYYYKNKINFTKCDITLMKYLLTQPEIKSKFNLQNILIFSDIDSSNKFLWDLLNGNFDINNIESFTNTEEKDLKYNNSVLEFLYLIIRDNLSIEKMAFRNVEFNFKMNDELYEKFYQKEKDKIKALVKNEIIHFILSKKNLVKRDDCIKYMEKNFDNNHLELVDEILKTNCEKIVLTNGLIEFSLKKDVLDTCDIDYIFSSKKRINAIEYMTNFQSNNFNISNINMIEPLNIEKKLIKNVYQSFYNKKNIDEMIKLYNLIYINKENAKLVNQIFYSNLTKILNFAYKLCSTDLLDEDFKKKLLEKMNLIEDKQFQKEKINEVKTKINIKEKLKKKYEKKNEIMKEKIISSNIIKEEEQDKKNEQETCVYCRQALNKDSNHSEYYGKICYYFSDYITDIMKKKPGDERKKARKFVSCNHKMHFKCFNEFIINFEKEFECPLCKQLSNIILYDFSNIIEDNYNIIKGLNYTNEKINLEEFYKINEGDDFKELLTNNILMFERYCSKLFRKQILIKDINEDKLY